MAHQHEHPPEHGMQQEPPGKPPEHVPVSEELSGKTVHEHHTPLTTGRPERHAVAHEEHHIALFRRRFWVCLFLTIPVIVYADLFQSLLGYTAPIFPGSQFVPFVFSSIIFFYGGGVFLTGAYDELSQRSPGMMTLVALAITISYVYSVATEFFLTGMPLYWELSTLIVIMLLGHWLEMRAVSSARGALAELAKLLPDTAERVVDGEVQQVRIEDLKVDDVVLVRPGGKIPVDGEVIQGQSSVNEAMVTGESRPIRKSDGSQVIAGTVNGEGSLRIRVTKTGEDTVLAGIMRLVEHAQQSRSRAQALADRAAYYLTLIAIVTGTLTLFVWLFIAGAPAEFAFERTVTVFVIACPHALGLAIPLVISISTTLAARNGLLVRERIALERARNLDVVMFDKTGTLTKGEQGVVNIMVLGGMTENHALALAAAAEGDSEHMIARGIRNAAEGRNLKLPAVGDFEALPGRGVRVKTENREVFVGGPRLLEYLDKELPEDLRFIIERWGTEGKTVVYLVADGEVRAAFALADVIREESREAVAELKSMGIEVAMLTGDSEDVARWVAVELGIDRHFAQVLPENKADKVKELQRGGKIVAMVGDGVNDAPALLTADVGIAIGAGTNVALESAGIILVRNDPRDVVRIVKLSRASYRKMIENLAWATGYNVVAIPLAAGVLAGFGIFLVPAVGAILMSASTVIVALNAQLLRRLEL